MLEIIIGLFITQFTLGFLVYSSFLRQYRRPILGILVIAVGLLTGIIVAAAPLYIALLAAVSQTYYLFHILRIAKGRQSEKQLTTNGIRSHIILLCLLASILLLWSVSDRIDINDYFWSIIAGLQLVFAIIFLANTLRSLRSTRLEALDGYQSDNELPTLTVAIPARNETEDLAESLESLLQNDYPKLEILVLDDCSQDNTSDIIRSFAHRGVRFIKGEPLRDGWLAKNQAYDQLADEASGKYVLFCGVDVRFDKSSLRMIVNQLLRKDIFMISFLPLRKPTLNHHFLLQPMRYWRELVIPRIFHATPPCLSTCWIVSRKELARMGGFEGLRRAIRPERVIARQFKNQHKYIFARADQAIGIHSIKGLKAQWQTAVRTRYPELHKRPESILLTSFWQIAFLWGPIALFVGALAAGQLIMAVASMLSILVLLITHSLVFYITTNRLTLEPLMLFPISVGMEIITLNYSMWAYEYSQVIWKGRNICIPVMKPIPRLPNV